MDNESGIKRKLFLYGIGDLPLRSRTCYICKHKRQEKTAETNMSINTFRVEMWRLHDMNIIHVIYYVCMTNDR